MVISRHLLDTELQGWFRNKRNTEKAKTEIIALFFEEPDDEYSRSEQDIWEQSRKIVDRWDRVCLYRAEGRLPLCSRGTPVHVDGANLYENGPQVREGGPKSP